MSYINSTTGLLSYSLDTGWLEVFVAKNETNSTVVIDNMMFYMRLTTISFDLWTFILTTTVIVRLAKQIIHLRKQGIEHKKRQLYMTSILYVMLLPLYALCNAIAIESPDIYDYMDSIMEFYLMLSCLFYFWQWRMQIHVYIEESFINPVKEAISNPDQLSAPKQTKDEKKKIKEEKIFLKVIANKKRRLEEQKNQPSEKRKSTTFRCFLSARFFAFVSTDQPSMCDFPSSLKRGSLIGWKKRRLTSCRRNTEGLYTHKTQNTMEIRLIRKGQHECNLVHFFLTLTLDNIFKKYIYKNYYLLQIQYLLKLFCLQMSNYFFQFFRVGIFSSANLVRQEESNDKLFPKMSINDYEEEDAFTDSDYDTEDEDEDDKEIEELKDEEGGTEKLIHHHFKKQISRSRTFTINENMNGYLQSVSKNIITAESQVEVSKVLVKANKHLYNIMLMRAKTIEFLPCNIGGQRCRINLQGSDDLMKARRFEIFWRKLMLFTFALEVIISNIDLATSHRIRDQMQTPSLYYSEFQYVPFDIMQTKLSPQNKLVYLVRQPQIQW